MTIRHFNVALTIVTTIVFAVSLLVSAAVQDADGPFEESASDAIFQELTNGLPTDGQRANSARLELEYWHKHQWSFLGNSFVRKHVKTKDGFSADVVFLTAPAMSMPGTDFSMAFLLLDKRVVDWASCWTHNRTAKQELLLEDVDGDGVLDVAFRASDGWWGLLDNRNHCRPDDERRWLYAFAFTAKGFKSLFAETEHDLKVKQTYETADQPVALHVRGLPEFLRERQMVECTLSVTNMSENELLIKPGEWFRVEMNKANFFMTYGPADKRNVLKPGESVSHVIQLYVEGTENEAITRWIFVPSP